MSTLPGLHAKFKHPVVDSGADPYVASDDHYFYYCYVRESDKTEIYINRANHLEDVGKTAAITVWARTENQPYSHNIWAPELHHLDGKWYIYFAAGDTPVDIGAAFPHHRMYVLESTSGPLGPYQMRGKISTPDDHWAIDGTILDHTNGHRYFVWSGWKNRSGEDQQLYIACMANPWTLEGERVMISQPEHDWELRGLAVNEGPQVLRQGNRVHIIYSASWSITDEYCLGQLDLNGDDPLNPSAWIKQPEPVFKKSANIVGVGHACFLLSPDGRYGWMVFHAARHPGAGWDRQVRLAAFTWDSLGKLRFLRTDRTLPVISAYRSLAAILKG
jgi:GH43 family beta-xylosidase